MNAGQPYAPITIPSGASFKDMVALTEQEGLSELEEENSGEDAAFADFDKVNKGNVAARLKEIAGDADAKGEAAVLNDWLKLNSREAELKMRLKMAEAALDAEAYTKYPKLTEAEIIY